MLLFLVVNLTTARPKNGIMYKLVYHHCTVTEIIQVWSHLNNIVS